MEHLLKNLFLYLLLLLIIPFSINGQSKLICDQTLNSKYIAEGVNYCLYLPPNYSTNNQYPTLYLLHGFGGNETSWTSRTNIISIVDSLTAIKQIPEIIIIIPDGKKSYFINDYQNKQPYENIIIKELIPFIDSTYCTSNKKSNRAIAGLSMGGFGATTLSLKHPDLFGTCINLSGAVRTDEQFINLSTMRYQDYFGPVYGDSLIGKDRITIHYKDNSPYYLVDSTSHIDYLNTNWYIDCGQSDFLFTANKALHELFLSYNIPHEYHMRQGSHNWEYWQKGITNAIIYWGEHLKSHR